jgi:hypothetical protein
MKIALQFRAFLDSYHYLSLPHIGKLESVSAVVNPLTGEVDKKSVRFISDPCINPDAELISFISQNLNIDACIAESDLFCFCNSLKELLIQGFEAEVPGIGFMHYESNRQLKFSGKSIYHSVAQKIRKKSVVILGSSFWL